MAIEPRLLFIPAAIDTASFVVRNLGGSPLEWRPEENSGFMLTPAAGVVAPGTEARVLLRVARDTLRTGEYVWTLRLRTNAFVHDSVIVRFQVPAVPPTLDSPAIDVAFLQRTAGTTLWNPTRNTIAWRTTAPSWMTVNPSSGTLLPHSSQPLSVAVRSWRHVQRDTTVHVRIAADLALDTALLAVRLAGPPPATLLADAQHEYIGSSGCDLVFSRGTALVLVNAATGDRQQVELPGQPARVWTAPEQLLVARRGGISLLRRTTLAVELDEPLPFDPIAFLGGPFLVPWNTWIIPGDASTGTVHALDWNAFWSGDVVLTTFTYPDLPPFISGWTDGGRLWLSTHAGLIRVNTTGAAPVVAEVRDVQFPGGDGRFWILPGGGADPLTSSGRFASGAGPLRTVAGETLSRIRDVTADGDEVVLAATSTEPSRFRLWDFTGLADSPDRGTRGVPLHVADVSVAGSAVETEGIAVISGCGSGAITFVRRAVGAPVTGSWFSNRIGFP